MLEYERLKIEDMWSDVDGNTSVDVSTAVGVSKTFDNGMVLSYTANNVEDQTKLTLTSDAVAITFGDFDKNTDSGRYMHHNWVCRYCC